MIETELTEEEQQNFRFLTELEFVQCLANPQYLNYLAQNSYLKKPEMVNYLKYLQYWKEPQYAKYLKYPMCLHMLELLQNSEFRKELTNGQCARYIEDQMLLHWQHYTRKRVLMQKAQLEQHMNRIAARNAANQASSDVSESLNPGGGSLTGK